ncbi:MAG: hypothetical protein MI974_23785 [Chitinophagales bacterium]|nr:hypothetical protein [Chitinophagales bacterium]
MREFNIHKKEEKKSYWQKLWDRFKKRINTSSYGGEHNSFGAHNDRMKSRRRKTKFHRW